MEKVTVSFPRLAELQKDHTLRQNAMESRIQKLIDRATVNGQPILGSILSFSHDRDELKQLAKCLDRAADLVTELDSMSKERGVFELAEKNPDRFAALFGDFEAELTDGDFNVFLSTPQGE